MTFSIGASSSRVQLGFPAILLLLVSILLESAAQTVTVSNKVSATGNTIKVTLNPLGKFTMDEPTLDPNHGTISSTNPSFGDYSDRHTIKISSGLSPSTEYTLTIRNISSYPSGSVISASEVNKFCTANPPFSAPVQDGAFTTGTSIKLNFTALNVPVASAYLDSNLVGPISNPETATEYTFDGLQPGYNGLCKIKITGDGSCEDKAESTAEQEIQCFTKSEVQFKKKITDENSIKFEAFVDDSVSATKDFKIPTAPIIEPPSSSALTMQPVASNKDHTKFTITAKKLLSSTAYTFKFPTFTAGTNTPIGLTKTEDSTTICTSEPTFNSLSQNDGETTGTSIAVSFGALNVPAASAFFNGNPTGDIPNAASATSYVFNNLQIGQAGKCKIELKGDSGCGLNVGEQEIDCYTKEEVRFKGKELTDNSVRIEAYIGSSYANTKDFKIEIAPTISPKPASAMVSQEPPSNTEAFNKFSISAVNLEPLTAYTLTFASLSHGSGTPVGLTKTSDTYGFCTTGPAVTDLNVTESGTNDTHIRITWQNPATGAPALRVSFDDNPQITIEADSEEYVFEEAAANTPFTAEQSGTCKVMIVGIAPNENCMVETSIPCATTKPKKTLSFAGKLMPQLTVLCGLFGMFWAQ